MKSLWELFVKSELVFHFRSACGNGQRKYWLVFCNAKKKEKKRNNTCTRSPRNTHTLWNTHTHWHLCNNGNVFCEVYDLDNSVLLVSS